MALTKITQTLVETGAIGSSQIASGAIGAAHLTNITTNHITEGNSNQFFTTARARSSLSGSTGVTYNSSSGAISIGQSVGTSDNVTFGSISGTSLSIDTLSMNGSSIGSSGNMTLDSANSLILDADGGDVMLKDNSVWFGNFNHNGNNLAIDAKIQDGDIVFRGNDGGSTITALTLDMSDGGAAIFNNDILLSDNRAVRFGDQQDFRIYNDGNHTTFHNASTNHDIIFRGNDDGSPITALTLDMSNAGKATFAGIVSSTTGLETGNMFITANEIDVSSGNLTLDVAGNIILNADGSSISLMDDTVNFGQFFSTGAGNFNIYSPTLNQDIKFLGNDGGSTITALTLDISNAGKATFNSDVVVGGDLIVNGTQTVLNTATLTVEDKIITVAHGASDAAAANESGINVGGASAQILYKSSGDKWSVNKDLEAAHSSGAMIMVDDTNGRFIKIRSANNGSQNANISSYSGLYLGGSDNASHVIIDNTGDVGIGVTPATNTKLTIGGTTSSYSSVLSFDNNTAGGATFFMLASDNTWNAGSNKFFMGHGAPSSSAVDMTIDADGKVGIKNTAPAATLEVGTLTSGSTGNVIINSEGGNPPALQVKSRTNRARINIQDNDTSGYIIAEGSVISIGFADQVSDNNININSSHDVGIGTDTPIAKLHIQDNTSTVYDPTGYQHELFIEKRNTAGNNQVGSIRFGVTGHDGSTTAEASIGVLQTANAHSGHMVFGTRHSGTRAERMRISSDGKVGIGTASPAHSFVVAEGTNQHGIEFAPGTLSYIQAYDRATSDYGNLKIDAEYIAFGTGNGAERMRIDSSGNLSLRQTGSASTNSVNMPPHFEFKGQGWDSNSGSDDMNAKIEMAATYGKVGSGATSPELVFSLQGAGGLDSSSESYVEAMRLVGAGTYNYNEPRLGVGTSAPSKRFDVYSNVNTGGAQITGGTSAANISLHINNTASNGVNWNISSTGGGHGYGDGQLQFGVAYGVPKMSIMSNGNVGIGAFASANPITPLHVLGNATIETGSPDLYFATTSASHNNWRLAAQETIDKGFEIASGNSQSAGSNAVSDSYTTRFVVKDSGFIGIGSHVPDAKLHLVDGNNYAKIGDLNSNSTMSLRMADSTSFPVEVQAFGSDLKLRTTTNSGGTPDDRIIVMAVTGHVGINNVDPNFLMHINKKAGDYDIPTSTGVVKTYFGVNTDYNNNGSQGIYLSHLNGNWVDGTSGGDSQYGMLFGYENSVRGGLIYDHRGSEMMSLWSSYAPIRFMTPDNADGNGVPLDSNINDRLHIAVGGNVGINENSPQKTLHVNSGSTNVVARFESSDGIAAIEFKDPSGTAEIGCSGNDIKFMPAGVVRSTIDNSGNFTTEGNINQSGGNNHYINTGGRVTGKVQDMINIGGDNWHHLPRYYSNFGFGTGGQISGYSVSSQNGQNSSWYAGLTLTGYVTWIPDVYIPYSLGQVYGMSASFFQHANNTAGTAVQYVGCIGYDAGFNFQGHDAIGTYQYNMSSSATFTAGTITELDVTLKGWQGSGQSDGNKMDRGTVYIRPMMLINYPWDSGNGGTTPSTTVMSFTMGPKHTFSDNDSNAGTNY